MENDKTENSVASLGSSASKCGTCAHFYRDKFHAVVGGGEQRGGQCPMLAEILGITNSNLWATKSIHVQDTFGCVLHHYKPTGSQDPEDHPVCVHCGSFDKCRC